MKGLAKTKAAIAAVREELDKRGVKYDFIRTHEPTDLGFQSMSAIKDGDVVAVAQVQGKGIVLFSGTGDNEPKE